MPPLAVVELPLAACQDLATLRWRQRAHCPTAVPRVEAPPQKFRHGVLRGQIMKTNNFCVRDLFLALTLTAGCSFFVPTALCQQQPPGEAPSSPKFPAAKAQAQTAGDAHADSDEGSP